MGCVGLDCVREQVDGSGSRAVSLGRGEGDFVHRLRCNRCMGRVEEHGTSAGMGTSSGCCCGNPILAADMGVLGPGMGFAAHGASCLCLLPSFPKAGGNTSSLMRRRKGVVGDLIPCPWIRRF